ncbi:T6SS immunity protein Tli3 family protein, partial [Enterobacter chuandaensis]|uniref:T6SS immunity protein Tli3 family protein n=1 Tax=Enterobacter chuandaensis TaxID=2497875 RepID=UPI003F4277CD
MKALFSGMAAAAVLMTSGCQTKEPPTQVVYRFDDHRYLELKGWDCEGELWYTDTQRGIHSQPYSRFYRIFT